MLVLLAASAPAFAPVVPVAPTGSRPSIMMQGGGVPPPIDEARRSRSPGLQNNFYDVPTDEFKRPRFGGGGGGGEFEERGFEGGRGGGPYGERGFGGGPYGGRGPGGSGEARGFGGDPYLQQGFGGEFGGRPFLGGAGRFREPPRFYGPYDRGYNGGAASNFVDIASNGAQFALLVAVLAAPKIPAASSVASLCGLAFITSGGLLAVTGALDLRTDTLRTEGVYALCRHPTYAGLIAGCVGLGFWTATPQQLLSRILLTGTLSALLWYKAEREEELLEQIYGPAYAEYAAYVPQFFPTLFTPNSLKRQRGPGPWQR